MKAPALIQRERAYRPVEGNLKRTWRAEMNFLKMIYSKWTRQELLGWNSFRKTAYLILPLLIYFLVHDAVEILLWAALDRILAVAGVGLKDFLAGNADTVKGSINGLAILAGVAALWPALWREVAGDGRGAVKGGSCEKEMPQGRKTANMPALVNHYVALAVLAVFSAFGLNLLFHVTGLIAKSSSYGAVSQAQYGVAFWAGLLLYGILSPFAEEAVFRGLIYNRMKRCFGVSLGMAVSAFLFGCYHGNMVQGIYGTLLGLVIAWVYEKYGSFAAPVLFHSLANISVYVFTYYGSLFKMGQAAGIGAMAAFFTGALFCLQYIRKNVGSMEPSKSIAGRQ